jgi:hypothetical protein
VLSDSLRSNPHPKSGTRLVTTRWSLASLSQVYSSNAAQIHLLSQRCSRFKWQRCSRLQFDSIAAFICIDTSFQIVPKVGVPSGWMKVTWRLRGKGILRGDQWAIDAATDVDVSRSRSNRSLSASAKQSQLRVAQQELRIPVESTFVPDEY